jgi:Glycosyltransferase family 9 (heptosyltransferase)
LKNAVPVALSMDRMACELPQDLGERWFLHMRRGDFAAAWRLSDAVLRARQDLSCAHLPRHLQWVWDGRSLHDKRVLIRCYHGLGDTVQFIRYAPMVKELGSQVQVMAPVELLPLLSTVRGIDALAPLETTAAKRDYDVDVEVMELPHVFRSTLNTLPAEIPYLHVAPAPRLHDGSLAVGIVWSAGPGWDPRRSISFSEIRPLARVPGVALFILQRGAAAAEAIGFGTDIGTDDILAAARIMRALDLVISVDSMPAHLAGALGVPVCTLLHKQADWRWMEEREDSPWYPTMRLFRQPDVGSWRPVIAAVAAELANLSSLR